MSMYIVLATLGVVDFGCFCFCLLSCCFSFLKGRLHLKLILFKFAESSLAFWWLGQTVGNIKAFKDAEAAIVLVWPWQSYNSKISQKNNRGFMINR